MIVAAWEMSFEMGVTPERRLRYNANEMFSGRVGREYWRSAREGRISTSANRRERRFHQILDEEYQKVISCGSGVTGTQESGSAREPNPSGSHAVMRRLVLVAAGAGIAILFRRLLKASGYRRYAGNTRQT